MKKIAGLVVSFFIGSIGFLVIFKLFFLDKIPREDEIAPGVIVFISLLLGTIFTFLGNAISNYFSKK